MSGINANLNVSGGPTIVVKKVDQAKLNYPNINMDADNRDLVKATGKPSAKADSTGDVVKAAMDKIANPPSPRQQMRGQQDSRNYNENGKAFKSTGNADTGN